MLIKIILKCIKTSRYYPGPFIERKHQLNGKQIKYKRILQCLLNINNVCTKEIVKSCRETCLKFKEQQMCSDSRFYRDALFTYANILLTLKAFN